MNYQESGVDIVKGDLFVEKIKSFIRPTYNEQVTAGVGGFAALYDQGDRFLAAGTDGVGTKLKLASLLGIHDTIGIDLVAMCVNDILCTGARAMFFLDYLATSKLDLEVHGQVIKGIAEGCLQSDCALIGGETAEMPGMYQDGEYDLAGFCVGEVLKSHLIDGSKIQPGMKILAFPSSGFHSNGFSLIRKLIKLDEIELQKLCLTPTRIYAQEVRNLIEKVNVFGLAHITGGGLNNIKRINPNWGYEINQLPALPSFMDTIIARANLTLQEAYTTFNMGIGMVVITDETKKAQTLYPELIEIGAVTSKFKQVKVIDQLI